MPKSTVSINDSTMIIPSSLILSTEAQRKLTALFAVAAALIATNIAVLFMLMFKPTTATPASPQIPQFNGRDVACVQVLRNGGMPRDCDRMYHLDFYP